MSWLILYKVARILLAMFTISVVHLFVVNFLPYPFNHINVVLAALLWFVFSPAPTRTPVMYVFLLFFSELFTSAPFGLSSLAMVLSLAAAHWLLVTVLTNRSVYMVLLAAALEICIYRTILLLLRFLHHLLTSSPLSVSRETLVEMGWEMLLTSMTMFVFYFITTRIFKRFDPTYVARKAVLYG